MRAIRFPKLHEIQWLIEPTTLLSQHIQKRTSSRPKSKNNTKKLISGIATSTMNRPGMRLSNSLFHPTTAPLHGCQREGGQLALDGTSNAREYRMSEGYGIQWTASSV